MGFEFKIRKKDGGEIDPIVEKAILASIESKKTEIAEEAMKAFEAEAWHLPYRDQPAYTPNEPPVRRWQDIDPDW